MTVDLREQHRWLEQLVGVWTYESEAVMGPGQAPWRETGTETVRSLEGVWVVCEARGDAPEGAAQATMMTLGYDPGRTRFVGTFVGSMMTHLWIYDGALDATGKVLTLETEGPSFTDEGRMTRYRDTIELSSRDERVLRSSHLTGDGEWHPFMTTTYRRTEHAADG